MPTTYYDTVHGELIGESTNGVTTTYLNDESGSVTATAQGGTLFNRYLYSPYGNVISRAGAGVDPRFLWVGSPGVRSTARAYAENYARERHMSSVLASWTTTDSFWPDMDAYAYANCNPTTYSDPSGLKPHRKLTDANMGDCGCVNVSWTFKTDESNGWLIQRITRKSAAKDCHGVSKTDQCGVDASMPNGITYYEAWQIKKHLAYPRGGKPTFTNDNWVLAQCGSCTMGSFSIDAATMVVKNLPSGFKAGNVKCALSLLSAWKLPIGFTFVAQEKANASDTWACCALKPGCKKPPNKTLPNKLPAGWLHG